MNTVYSYFVDVNLDAGSGLGVQSLKWCFDGMLCYCD